MKTTLGPTAIKFEQKGRARMFLLINGKWEWVLTYDHRSGEVKLYLPLDTIEALQAL